MNEILASRIDDVVTRILSLRLAVGMLGERDNEGWWASNFMSRTSAAFLTPVFGTNILEARYQGVLEAAKRVHDERIGLGHVFHLFRLPESMEHRLFEAIQSERSDLVKAISSPESANATLQGFVTQTVAARSGPAFMASPDAIETTGWMTETGALYSAAFCAGVQCFPYFTEVR